MAARDHPFNVCWQRSQVRPLRHTGDEFINELEQLVAVAWESSGSHPTCARRRWYTTYPGYSHGAETTAQQSRPLRFTRTSYQLAVVHIGKSCANSTALG